MRSCRLTLVIIILFASILLAQAEEVKPQRIVSLTLGTDEILLSLVETPRVLAVTNYALDDNVSNVSEAAKAVPQHIKNAGVETVVALNPDLVLAATYSSADVIKQLKDLGLPVVTLRQFSSLEGIEENIRIVGRAVGESEKAEALISEMQQRLKILGAQLPKKSARPVLLSYDVSGWTAGSETTFDALVSLAGGRNLAAEAGIVGHKKISLETVVAMNPEVMIYNTWTSDVARSNAALIKKPALQSVAAVKNGRLHGVPGKYLTTVSHYIVQGVEAMARLLYPKVFAAKSP